MRLAIPLVFFISAGVMIISCESKSDSGRFDHLDQRTKIRLRQYLVEGRRLYDIYCSNCHQKNGEGLARLYPPLRNSDYILPNREKVICSIRYGQQGSIIVNGVEYNQPMPANLNITDLEIAEIATFVFTEFADSVQIVTINEVRQIMRSCQKDTVLAPQP